MADAQQTFDSYKNSDEFIAAKKRVYFFVEDVSKALSNLTKRFDSPFYDFIITDSMSDSDLLKNCDSCKPSDKFIAEAQKRLLVFLEDLSKSVKNLFIPSIDEQQNTEQCPPSAQ